MAIAGSVIQRLKQRLCRYRMDSMADRNAVHPNFPLRLGSAECGSSMVPFGIPHLAIAPPVRFPRPQYSQPPLTAADISFVDQTPAQTAALDPSRGADGRALATRSTNHHGQQHGRQDQRRRDRHHSTNAPKTFAAAYHREYPGQDRQDDLDHALASLASGFPYYATNFRSRGRLSHVRRIVAIAPASTSKDRRRFYSDSVTPSPIADTRHVS